MRPRRSSVAPTPPRRPPPFCAHCETSLPLFAAYIRCAICPDLALCPHCFRVGAHDAAPHRPDHDYRVVDRPDVAPYAPDWAVDEELRLLAALAEHGPFHWKTVAEHVVTKGPRKCQQHYHAVYLSAPSAPLPPDQLMHNPDPSSPAPQTPLGPATTTPSKSTKRRRKSKSKSTTPNLSASCAAPEPETQIPATVEPLSPAAPRVVAPAPRPPPGAIEGFQPLRGDFDVEWDDSAEDLIADLVIDPDDSQEERDLKTRLLELYDERLQRREAVKSFLLDRALLQTQPERRGPRDEKELSARLQIFARCLSQDEFAAFQNSVLHEFRLAKDLHRLTQARDQLGMRSRYDLAAYDIERKARSAALAKPPGRVHHSTTPGYSPAKVEDKLRTQAPNPVLEHIPLLPAKLSVDDMDTVAAAIPPDVQIAEPSPQAVVSTATLSPQDTLDTTASRATLQRKARERRLVATAPFPLVQAMFVSDMECAEHLSGIELRLCSALNIPPKEFLILEQAMLQKCAEDARLRSQVSSSSTNADVHAVRATRAAGAENDISVGLACGPVAVSAGDMPMRVDVQIVRMDPSSSAQHDARMVSGDGESQGSAAQLAEYAPRRSPRFEASQENENVAETGDLSNVHLEVVDGSSLSVKRDPSCKPEVVEGAILDSSVKMVEEHISLPVEVVGDGSERTQGMEAVEVEPSTAVDAPEEIAAQCGYDHHSVSPGVREVAKGRRLEPGQSSSAAKGVDLDTRMKPVEMRDSSADGDGNNDKSPDVGTIVENGAQSGDKEYGERYEEEVLSSGEAQLPDLSQDNSNYSEPLQGRIEEEILDGGDGSSLVDKDGSVVFVSDSDYDGNSLFIPPAKRKRSRIDENELYVAPKRARGTGDGSFIRRRQVMDSSRNQVCETELASEPPSEDGNDSVDNDADNEYVPDAESPPRDERPKRRCRGGRGEVKTPIRKSSRLMSRIGTPGGSGTSSRPEKRKLNVDTTEEHTRKAIKYSLRRRHP